MIQVLLVDDHPTIMEGTKMLLEQEGDIKAFLAYSGEHAIDRVKVQHFNVILVDLHMPDMNGIDLAKQIITISSDVAIILYTGFEFNNHFNLMIESGISGFVLKTANRQQLVTAVRCALRGEVVLPLSLVKQLRRTHNQTGKNIDEVQPQAINDQEYQILKEIAKGKSNKEIAAIVFMSQRSLEYCLTNLFQKLHVKSRIEAAIKAKEMDLLTDSDFIKL
ncbi:response regulator transcription factor [Paenibacillus sp. S3N08]|uniref:Response regulator transcription factor n=2 Tax=Paenibacillus agricola TaxID=2716264 RepID=A0ABX0JFE3_9BACL|nr:response regulator transcription factor [Paenibacillus agricola]